MDREQIHDFQSLGWASSAAAGACDGKLCLHLCGAA